LNEGKDQSELKGGRDRVTESVTRTNQWDLLAEIKKSERNW